MRRFLEGAPRVLDGDVDLDVEPVDERRARLRLRRGRARVSLSAAALPVPYPSGLRRLQAELPDVEVVVVERAPEGLRAAARRAGISWLDLDGAGRIDAGGIAYDAPPKGDVVPDGRVNVSPFAPAASRVVKVLLSDPERAWRLSEVAQMAQINPGNAHRALMALLRDGMLERADRAYVVTDAPRMLDAWAARYVPPRERLRCAADRGLTESVARLVASESKVVVSGELAAEHLAPYLPASRAIVHCLDPEAFSSLARRARAGCSPPGSASEVVIDLADRGAGAFAVERAGLPLAAPVQVYVDMARDLGRGREAAEHLRGEAIGF